MTTDPIDSGLLDWIFDGQLAELHGYTEGELKTLARVLSQACPTCSAPVGAWCRTSAGQVLGALDRQHQGRRLARG